MSMKWIRFRDKWRYSLLIFMLDFHVPGPEASAPTGKVGVLQITHLFNFCNAMGINFEMEEMQ